MNKARKPVPAVIQSLSFHIYLHFSLTFILECLDETVSLSDESIEFIPSRTPLKASVDCTIATSQPKSKKRKQLKPAEPISRMDFYRKMPRMPRLLKSDNRRHYGHALINVFNTTDWITNWQFFSKYFQADFETTYSVSTGGANCSLIPFAKFNGVPQVMEYFFLHTLVAPDLCLLPKNTTVSVRSDQMSKIELEFAFRSSSDFESDFTKQMLYSTIEEEPDTESTVLGGDHYIRVSSRAHMKMAKIRQHFRNMRANDPIIQSAALPPLELKGRVVLNIDQQHKIYSAEFVLQPHD